MFDSLVLHDLTATFVNAYVARPKQGILLTGKDGVGLGTLAETIALSLVGHKTDLVIVAPDEKGTIPIERVRQLYIETRDIRQSKQVVIIDDIDAMSNDAQNAFLKLLEEPNETVYFILTSHHADTLLQTITSRVQSIEVLPISTTDSQSLLRSKHITDATTIRQMLFIASGLPAELIRMATDKPYFEERSRFIRLARDFLTSNAYSRLTMLGQLTTRQDALGFVDTLSHVLTVMGQSKPELLAQSTADIIETTAQRLAANGHIRTQLTNLALHVV